MTPPARWLSLVGKILLFALCAAPVIYGFWIMTAHWVPLPYWDEWDSPGGQLASYYRGTLSWAELFSQHNESRSFFPRLAYLTLAIAFGWDVRNQMLLTFACACAASFGLYLLLRKTNPSPRAVPLVFAAMNFLFFSPRQYENFLDGLMGEAFTPAVALVFALRMNLANRSLKTKTLVNAALALLATYTFANGMLVWLLGFPLANSEATSNGDRRRFLWRAVYGAIAVAAVGSYFSTYRHPPLSPPFVSPLSHVPEFAGFVLTWIGSVFTIGAPAICGAAVVFLFLAFALVAIKQMRRVGEWRPYYPWLVLGCYTLISGSIVAAGRLGFSYSMAGDVRYTASSALIYVAVVGLGFTVAVRAQPRPLRQRLAVSTAVLAALLLALCWRTTLRKERRLYRLLAEAREHSLLVLRWSEAIPLNPEIALLSPYPVEQVTRTIRTLAEHDALRPRLVGESMARAIKEFPKGAGPSVGRLEEATIDVNGKLSCRGLANVPADCVVLGLQTEGVPWQPYYVVGTSQSGSARFSATLEAKTLPRHGILRATAIDSEREQVSPIAGAIPLESSP